MLIETGLNLSDPSLLSGPFERLFGNAFFAGFYLALPFIFLLALDFLAGLKRKLKIQGCYVSERVKSYAS